MRMTWAGQEVTSRLDEVLQTVKRAGPDVLNKTFVDFNECLTIGYMENDAISVSLTALARLDV
jgi:hypothetical protein